MTNPVKFITAGLKAVSLAGKSLGKAQKLFAALLADEDDDGTPEWKEAVNGCLKLFHKLKDESLPLAKQALLNLKEHLGGYREIFMKDVLPNVISVFNGARKAVLED